MFPRFGKTIVRCIGNLASQSGQVVLQKSALDSRGFPVALRLRVDSGGCGGFSYRFEVVPAEESSSEDKVFVQDGQKVLVDSVSLSFLKDCEVDYHEEMVRSSFRVTKNALADSSCGCDYSVYIVLFFTLFFPTTSPSLMFLSLGRSLRLSARFDPGTILHRTKIKRRLYMAGGLCIAVGTFDYKFQECLQVVDNPAGVLDPHKLFFARMFFGRLRSQLIGSLLEKELPVSLREPVYRMYAKATGVDLDEIRYPLDSFRSVQEFFSRPLKKGARPNQSSDPLCLLSPADAEVIAFGDVTEDRLPQVKGTSYSLKGFLGLSSVAGLIGSPDDTKRKNKSAWKYVVLYLCPGDYHRFHSPADFTINQGKHFSGEVLSVNKLALKCLNDVFSVNERVVLSGSWSQGEMYYTAVAAHGVGNIKLSFENNLKTNDARTVPVYLGGDVRTRNLGNAFLKSGEELGMFKLGSTIVLVFEASNNMKWTVSNGDKVKVGEVILDYPKQA